MPGVHGVFIRGKGQTGQAARMTRGSGELDVSRKTCSSLRGNQMNISCSLEMKEGRKEDPGERLEGAVLNRRIAESLCILVIIRG